MNVYSVTSIGSFVISTDIGFRKFVLSNYFSPVHSFISNIMCLIQGVDESMTQIRNLSIK